MELTPRQLKILEVIVQNYIESAEPVGSRTIAKKYDLGVSSATVRNEMADLEDLGLLTQPHTSAGRIPSDSGYRIYVDALMPKKSLEVREIAWFEAILNRRKLEKERVVSEIATVLSSVTNYTTLVLGPFISPCTLKEIALIPVASGLALAVVVTDNGLTASQQIEIPSFLSSEDLQYIARALNTEFAGKATQDVKPATIRCLVNRVGHHINRFEYALENLIEQLQVSDQEKVFFGGAANILAQPEFKDVERYRQLATVLAQQQFVYQLLAENISKGLTIRIGQENDQEEVKDCSIITASYESEGRIIGSIGLLGPTRMTYSRGVALLDYITARLADIL